MKIIIIIKKNKNNNEEYKINIYIKNNDIKDIYKS